MEVPGNSALTLDYEAHIDPSSPEKEAKDLENKIVDYLYKKIFFYTSMTELHCEKLESEIDVNAFMALTVTATQILAYHVALWPKATSAWSTELGCCIFISSKRIGLNNLITRVYIEAMSKPHPQKVLALRRAFQQCTRAPL